MNGHLWTCPLSIKKSSWAEGLTRWTKQYTASALDATPNFVHVNSAPASVTPPKFNFATEIFGKVRKSWNALYPPAVAELVISVSRLSRSGGSV